MVWICEVCNGKNNNSSIKCRINKCHALKPQKIILKEQKILEESFKRDLCPTCKTHQDFVRKSKRQNQWICKKCHKIYRFKGKPVPEYVDDGKSNIF